MLSRKNIIESITAILVFLFIYTGLSKYQTLNTFRAVLHKSPILRPYSGLIAITLPGIEILLSILLIIPKTRRVGLRIAAVMLGVFTIYLIYMVSFTPQLPCTCGGIIQQLSWTQHIFLNLTLLGISMWAIYLTKKSSSHPSQYSPTT